MSMMKILVIHICWITNLIGIIQCNSNTSIPGCTKDQHQFHCDIRVFDAKSLPPMTNLTLYIANNYNETQSLKGSNFSDFKGIKRFTIADADQENFVNGDWFTFGEIDRQFFIHLRDLTFFRWSIAANIKVAENAFEDMNSLQVLDFTRVSHLNMTSLIASLPSLSKNPLHTLILRRIQWISNKPSQIYNLALNLSAIICPLHKTLRVLDLSNNAYQTIILAYRSNCNPSLKVLNLQYNNIHGVVDNNWSHVHAPFFHPVLSGIESLMMDHQWQVADANNAILTETSYPQDTGKGNTALYAVKMLKGWLEEMNENCPNMIQPNATMCIGSLMIGMKSPVDEHILICNIFKCATRYTVNCDAINENLDVLIAEYLGKECNMTHCYLNMILPWLFGFEEIHISDFISIFSYRPPPLQSSICIAKNNNLRVLNISNSKVGDGYFADRKYLQNSSITGLHSLKYLGIQNCNLVLSSGFVRDMPALEEMYIGGNELTDGTGTLSAAYFSNKKQLQKVGLSYAELRSITKDAFIDSHNLNALDLSNNAFTVQGLDFDLSNTALSELDLRDNLLESISLAMQAQLDALAPLSLHLQGNPLRCDCSTLEFVKWAHNSKDHKILFEASHTYICFDGKKGNTLFSIDIDAMEEECQSWRQIAIIIGAFSAATLGVTFIIIIWSKQWEIRQLLFLAKERLTAFRYQYPSHQFEYDAFILYSGELNDRLWVHQKLVRHMERQYGFHFCIHLRDFMPGNYITDNVLDSINKSRRVIAVVSPHFAESGWCIEELQMAMSVDRDARGHQPRKLMVIMLRDFPLGAEIPSVIRLVLAKRYLKWKDGKKNEQLFWKRLNSALYPL